VNRVPALGGWRGIAILLVVADFAAHPLGFTGQHGVSIFFVLSGCLITSRLQEELRAGGRICSLSFAEDRRLN